MDLEVQKIWLDGKTVDFKGAQTHLLTHALHYGSGVFEGIRFYETDKGPAIFRLEDHLKRLFFSAESIEMKVLFSLDVWDQAVKDLIKTNELTSGYVRPLIYYGYGKMGLNPTGAKVNCVLMVWPWGAYLGKDVVKIKTSPFIRIHPQSCIQEAKVTGYYANSIMATLDAHKDGFDEALMLDYEGNVAEGPGENIFMVKDGVLVTPPPGNILAGLTRAATMEFAEKEFGVKTEERTITLDEIKQADEVFFTGTAAEITPIGQIDEAVIGKGETGSLTEKIKNFYLDIVHGKQPSYEKWLTYVS